MPIAARPRRIRVYPRVCGGTSASASGDIGQGLSPRVRGNPRQTGHLTGVVRSIPACAGEPHPGGSGGTEQKVYPACAGEPPGGRAGVGSILVYPRVCGGTSVAPTGFLLSPGLSPRVRGNLFGELHKQAGRGSIPACAGEPVPEHSSDTNIWVYPRVCGGTSCEPLYEIRREGLSPRVRGNPFDSGFRCQYVRSIPACAGEPVTLLCQLVEEVVYPRVCGGTVIFRTRYFQFYGLSPRVRGNHSHLVHCLYPSGSIPACAGEPHSSQAPIL